MLTTLTYRNDGEDLAMTKVSLYHSRRFAIGRLVNNRCRELGLDRPDLIFERRDMDGHVLAVTNVRLNKSVAYIPSPSARSTDCCEPSCD
jgi:hypothetical protein